VWIGTGVVLSFALAALVCVPNALSYAELSNHFPALVGGAYMYSYSTFNELTAFLVFCHLMLDYHIGAASITRSLASYFVTLLQVKFYLIFSSDDMHLLQQEREP
jgi:APA family basic amino acid/polyamine antiporter